MAIYAVILGPDERVIESLTIMRAGTDRQAGSRCYGVWRGSLRGRKRGDGLVERHRIGSGTLLLVAESIDALPGTTQTEAAAAPAPPEAMTVEVRSPRGALIDTIRIRSLGRAPGGRGHRYEVSDDRGRRLVVTPDGSRSGPLGLVAQGLYALNDCPTPGRPPAT